MCGIAGVLKIYKPGRAPPGHRESIPDAWLDILDDSIKHRGPDGSGRFRDRATRPDGTVVDVALVHRRMSIIDHAGGAQPMVHVRRAEGSDELIQPPIASDIFLEGAPRASEGTDVHAGLGNPDSPRLRDGLFSGGTGVSPPSPPTIDATEIHNPDLVAVAFNGCIYNHRRLRAELEAEGHRFHTDHTDTEVLIHGWRAWGKMMIPRLRSMHAFMLWDRQRANMLISSDRFAQKPLLIGRNADRYRDADLFVFSSAAPGLVRVLALADPYEAPLISGFNSAANITYGHAGSCTPWDRVIVLPPYVAAVVLSSLDRTGTDGDPLQRRLDHDDEDRILPKRPMHSFQLASKRTIEKRTIGPLDDLLADVVIDHLDADVPVACLLSGGVDSSLISHYAKQALGDLTTVCVRMPDPRYDESEHARLVADHLGTDHVEVDADPDAASDLVHLIEMLGLPFGDSSLLPTYWACRAAGAVAPVLLTGDGGDEMFVGYDRHMVAGRLNELSMLLVPVLIARLIPTVILPQRDPKAFSTRLARLILALRRASYVSLLSIFPAPDAARLLGKDARKPAWFSLPGSPYEAALLDRRHTLPGDYLRKVDIASMAVPVETRAPFLDDRVRRASDEIGEQLTARGRKGLLRMLARRHLPRSIVDRSKQGFAIPIGEWFRDDFGGMRQLLYDHLESADPFPGLAEAGLEIRMPFVRRMLREHDAAGEAPLNPWHGRDHTQRLYMLLVLSIWAKWLHRIGPAPSPRGR